MGVGGASTLGSLELISTEEVGGVTGCTVWMGVELSGVNSDPTGGCV